MANITTIERIKGAIRAHITSSPQAAARFFKMGEGEYSQHDNFLGVAVPSLRKIAGEYQDAPLTAVQELLASEYNEERMLALVILVRQYQIGHQSAKDQIYRLYLDNLRYVNNWNLVDASAHFIVGAHAQRTDQEILRELACSDNLWKRRVAIVATWYSTRAGDVEPTFAIARMLLADTHDLIHKAVGWMLREAGKRDLHALLDFLTTHASAMPRTMLRYAMEKLTPDQKKGIGMLVSRNSKKHAKNKIAL